MKRFPQRLGSTLSLLAIISSIAAPLIVQAATASLYFLPDSASKKVGDTFTVTLKVNSGGVAINAAEGTVTFPTNLLQVKSVSKASSVFTLWPVEPTLSNSAGTVVFSGGKPNPGYTGSGGTLFSIVFTAKVVGTARLALAGVHVLKNDGLGTDITGAVGSASIKIAAAEVPPPPPPPTPTFPDPVITSATNPNQSAWTQQANVSATWTAGEGVLGYNVVFDQNAGTDAPQVDQGLTHELSRSDLADGAWYLHVRARYEKGWSATKHFRFQIDRTAPAAFDVAVARDAKNMSTVTLNFSTTDAASGIDHYAVKIDDGPILAATSPKILEHVLPGNHTVLVLAVDRADNSTVAKAAFEVIGPETPAVTFEAGDNKIPFQHDAIPVVLAGQVLRLRGVSRKTDTIHVVLHSTETVFDFPVADNIDPAPVQPVPADMTAWKIEFSPTLSAGDHEMRVSVCAADGPCSVEAPVIHFRVLSGAVRVGSYIMPLSTVVLFESFALLGLFVIILMLIGWIWYERRTLRRVKRWVDARVQEDAKRPGPPAPPPAINR